MISYVNSKEAFNKDLSLVSLESAIKLESVTAQEILFKVAENSSKVKICWKIKKFYTLVAEQFVFSEKSLWNFSWD